MWFIKNDDQIKFCDAIKKVTKRNFHIGSSFSRAEIR